MPTESFGIFLFTESPLHAGAGSTLSYIDLPIQRETHTGHPVVYASGVKGALRDKARNGAEKLSPAYTSIFGPDLDDKPDEHGGLGIFQEARVCLLPVRSFEGVYVWLTCPLVLHRLQRDLIAILPFLKGEAKSAAEKFSKLNIPTVTQGAAVVAQGSHALVNDKKLCLDNMHFSYNANEAVNASPFALWFSAHALPDSAEYEWWRNRLSKHFAILNDSDYTHLVRTSTHFENHIAIDPTTGTVKDGALWLEESLPPDTLLWSTITLPDDLDTVRKAKRNASPQSLIVQLFTEPRFQMCGGRSTGMGWVRARLLS